MNPRRLLVALLSALLLSGALTYFLTRRINGRNGRPAAQATQKYVAASRPLPAGELLKPENLTLVEWPVNVPLQGAFSKIEDVAGRAVVYPMAARQPVLEGYLAVAGSGIGLTVKIPDGMRAASVRSDEVIGVAGFLFPSCHVDVLVTFRNRAGAWGKGGKRQRRDLAAEAGGRPEAGAGEYPGLHPFRAPQWGRPRADRSGAGAGGRDLERGTLPGSSGGGACPCGRDPP